MNACDRAVTLRKDLEMEIEYAAAKIRATGVADEEEDYAMPVRSVVLPLQTLLGEPEECPRGGAAQVSAIASAAQSGSPPA